MRKCISVILVLAIILSSISPVLAATPSQIILGLEAVEYTSCPYVYVFNGSDYVLENDIISVARMQANEYTDYLFINNPMKSVDGKLKVRISEPAGEASNLDLLALNVVNHPEGTKAGVDEKGQAHTYSNPVAPIQATGSDVNALGKLSLEDQQGVLLYDNESVICEFPEMDLSKGAKVVLKVEGFKRDDSLVDAINPKVPAIEIQTLENGLWITRSTFYPKALDAYGVFDIKPYLSSGNQQIRLLSRSCRQNVAHLIDYVALDNSADQCSQSALPLVSALKNGVDDVSALINNADSNYAGLTGGTDALDLEYSSVDSPGLNDYFLTSKGFYQSTDNTFYLYTKDSSGTWQYRWSSSLTNYYGVDKKVEINVTTYLKPEADGAYQVKIRNKMNWYPKLFAYIDNVYLKIDGKLCTMKSAVDAATGEDILDKLNASDDNKWSALDKETIITFAPVDISKPPVAVDDSYAVNEDEVLTIAAPGTLGNDTDVDADPLTAIKLSEPANGTVTLNADGSFTYTPKANFNGMDSFTYKANDGKADSNVATVSIKVNSINDVPEVGVNNGGIIVNEGQTAVNAGTWSDVDLGDVVTLSASTGNVTQNADGTWSWSFSAIDGPADSQAVIITATDKAGATGTAKFNLTVNNVNPIIKSITAPTGVVQVETPVTVDVAFNDAGILDTHSVTFAWGDGTSDTINLVKGSYSTNATHTYIKSGVFTVNITVEDKDGGTDKGSVSIDVNGPPVIVQPADVAVNEGDIATNTIIVSDPDNDPITLIASFGTITKNADGTWSWSFNAIDDLSQLVALTAYDGRGGKAEAAFSLKVNNVSPTVGQITAPVDPVLIGTPINVSTTFTDPGKEDTHTAIFEWGDGTTAELIATGGVAAADHTYTKAGVYTIKVTVIDDDGGMGESTYQYVVVYDPSAGFVTGGGWINSPAGAYPADPTLSGKATFGFVSKYQKGANIPTGNTEFQFHVAGMKFKSTSYEWLVVAGAKAQYKGEGTINGTGSYGFILTAIDGQLSGGGDVDKFRIKIWDKATGAVVYDNQMDVEVIADPTTTLSAGSIVIHKQ